MQQRALRCLSALLYACAVVGGVWLTVRFLLPWSAPFLVALALATLLEPAVKRLASRGIRRSFAAGALTLLLLALLLWGLCALGAKGLAAATDFALQTPALMDTAGRRLAELEKRVLAYIESAPAGAAATLRAALDGAAGSLRALPARLSQWVLDLAGKAAQAGPGALLFAATAGIGTYFISASYPRILAFFSAQLPEDLRRRLEGLGRDLKGSFGGLLRAQLILMAMTFFELLLVFLPLRVRGAVGLAALTSLIDALPVFGTGTVLIPWALCCLLLGSYGRGLALLLCWLGVSFVRNAAQAKLLGDQIGLDPVASLIAVYVGWRVWGVWGMLLFPVLFVTLRQLNDKGVIRLWKNV